MIKALNLNDQPVLRVMTTTFLFSPIELELIGICTFLQQQLVIEELSEMVPLCLPCFDSEQVRIVARIPVSGFLPRQTGALEINVQNRSSVEISHFIVELVQVNIRIIFFLK